MHRSIKFVTSVAELLPVLEPLLLRRELSQEAPWQCLGLEVLALMSSKAHEWLEQIELSG